ncbi:hypothetical protein DD764_06050 [Helicobacter pylori]|nr:hypothetical protein DD764_06050 [Helicobacter pylori]
MLFKSSILKMMKMMIFCLMGMINKGLLLEKKFYIEIRGTALKNAYHIVGGSIKKTPTIIIG